MRGFEKSKSPALTLTVIFICYNNVDDLRSTYNSLKIAKNYINEILIVDSSIDHTVKRFSEVIGETHKTSYKWEPAQGIYHAMNTGLMMANRESIVWYLNPGDVLIDAASLVNLLQTMVDQGALWGFGQTEKVMKGNLEVFPREQTRYRFEDLLFGSLSVSHQSTFCVASALIELGGFDEQYQIASDLKMQVELMKIADPAVLFEPIVRIDPNGVSHNKVVRTYIETSRIRLGCSNVSRAKVFWNVFKFPLSKLMKHGLRMVGK